MGDFEEKYNKLYEKAIIKDNICECNVNIEKKIQKMSVCTQKIGFTLTFSKMWHEEDLDTLYKYFIEYVQKNFGTDTKYIIAPEFTSAGIMHFHGIVYSCYQRCVNKKFVDWRKTFGFVKMEYKISEHWEKYITKDMCNIGYPVSTNV